MKKEEPSILLSEKHGLNPTIVRCTCCGKDHSIALLGKLKNDAEAPKEIYQGLCDSCQSVVDNEGVIFIEVKDGESGDTPYRTGRIIGLNKDFKERNNIPHSIMYMPQIQFTQLFGNLSFNKE